MESLERFEKGRIVLTQRLEDKILKNTVRWKLSRKPLNDGFLTENYMGEEDIRKDFRAVKNLWTRSWGVAFSKTHIPFLKILPFSQCSRHSHSGVLSDIERWKTPSTAVVVCWCALVYMMIVVMKMKVSQLIKDDMCCDAVVRFGPSSSQEQMCDLDHEYRDWHKGETADFLTGMI